MSCRPQCCNAEVEADLRFGRSFLGLRAKLSDVQIWKSASTTPRTQTSARLLSGRSLENAQPEATSYTRRLIGAPAGARLGLWQKVH